MIELSISRKDRRELDLLTEAEVIRHYDPIRRDPEAFVHSCLFTEWLLGILTGSEPSHPMFHLIGSALENFAEGAPFWPVLCSGIERLLRLSGFAMEVDRCTKCGKPLETACMWNATSGGIVCSECDENAVSVPAGLVAFIRKSRKGGLDSIRNLKLWPGGYMQCHELMRAFAEIHLETRLKLKSLAVLEELENDH